MSLSSENPDTTEFTSGYDNITSDAQTGSEGLGGETILYIVIGCIGLLGNGFVIVVIYKTPLLRKKLTSWFLINQSLLDFYASILLIAQSVTEVSKIRIVFNL